MEETRPAIVLFDGVCNLCNTSVQFIIDHDPAEHFRFASLQSAAARTLLEGLGERVPAGTPESVILVEGGQVYTHSTAALRIAWRLRGPVRLVVIGLLFPRFLRDAVYRWIARHRYRWFGRTETCRVPTPALRRRFLDAVPAAETR